MSKATMNEVERARELLRRAEERHAEAEKPCDRCSGTGLADYGVRCPNCDGAGKGSCYADYREVEIVRIALGRAIEVLDGSPYADQCAVHDELVSVLEKLRL